MKRERESVCVLVLAPLICILRAGWLTQAYVDRYWQRANNGDWWHRVKGELNEGADDDP